MAVTRHTRPVALACALLVGTLTAFTAAAAQAHKPPKLLSAQLAQSAADQKTLRCQGFLGNWMPGQQPAPRYVGGGTHYRAIEATTMNGHLEVFVWRVRVKHDAGGSVMVGTVKLVGSTSPNWQTCA
jgi:hypothetical protein